MKKVLLVLVCLLALTACGSNHYSNVSEGTEVIYKDAEGNSFTKEDLYKSIWDIIKYGNTNANNIG